MSPAPSPEKCFNKQTNKPWDSGQEKKNRAECVICLKKIYIFLSSYIQIEIVIFHNLVKLSIARGLLENNDAQSWRQPWAGADVLHF